ncbi:hypothetical protein AMAG_09724 [Allomyces macrogynus ATCC 38327]|uniref:Uncharacterized protein n=1 Tax=Allomyces macrogynus (strain ATCC 38327) TaxID=578462 RepID=A0A0L0STB9_ALLM3|nr:hypothetical protein AMAG_09724 [Allomyces macrogynus ATCC 38327]|eukprot:KNE65746.1 hypothetical protein AMAG_09724 [Allomyces macrogynus ATCC 38327]
MPSRLDMSLPLKPLTRIAGDCPPPSGSASHVHGVASPSSSSSASKSATTGLRRATSSAFWRAAPGEPLSHVAEHHGTRHPPASPANGPSRSQQALDSVARTLFDRHFRHQTLRVGVAPGTAQFAAVPTDRPLLGSVALHLLLWFTALLFPFWMGIMVYVTWAKIHTSPPLNTFYQFTFYFCLVLFLVVEPGRLLLGLRGNRREKVPELAGFLLLTGMPQAVVLVYFAYLQRVHAGAIVYPVEVALNGVYLAVLVVPQGWLAADWVAAVGDSGAET